MNATKKRIIPLCLLIITLIVFLLPVTAFAAKASASISASSIKKGNSVTVTVSFSGENIGAVMANFTYDSSVLQFSSGSGCSGSGGSGKIVLYASSENASSLKTSLKFKGLKAGSSKITFSASEILSFDEKSLGSASTGVTIKVTDGSTATTKPSADPTKKPAATATKKPTTSSSASAAPTPSPSPTINPLEQAIPVTVENESLLLWTDLSSLSVPEGFTLSKVTYEDKDVAALTNEEKTLTLVYLSDEKGENAAYYLFDTQSEAIYPYQLLNAKGEYTILRPNDTVSIPEGYVDAKLVIDEITYPAWQLSENEQEDFYLLYAMNPSGNIGFYLYDATEKTMQRFFDRTVVVEPEPTPTPAPTPTPSPAPSAAPVSSGSLSSLYQQITGNSTLLLFVCVLAGIILLLIIILIVVGVKLRRVKKLSRMEDALPAGSNDDGAQNSSGEGGKHAK